MPAANYADLSILSTKEKVGRCRICGESGPLSLEHVIPRSAGGGEKMQLYNTSDLITNPEKAYGEIKQNGTATRTICSKCNNKLGRWYDKEFSKFYKVLNIGVDDEIKKLIDSGEIQTKNELSGKWLKFGIKEVRPFCIAKRILAMFCSIDYPGLTDKIPEIQKAILDKNYVPSISDFSIFLCLCYGNGAFFSTIATLKLPNIVDTFAGIESLYIGLYLKQKSSNPKNVDTLDNCANITNWLTECEPNKQYEINFTLPFVKTMALDPPIPQKTKKRIRTKNA